MRVSSTVTINDHWRQYRAELDAAIVKSLGQAVGAGLAAGRSKRPRPVSYKIQAIQQKTGLVGPVKFPGGWLMEIRWTDFRARFFEVGTYQKLGRILTKRSKEGAGGNRGVKPQRFVRAARRAARSYLVAALNRNLQ